MYLPGRKTAVAGLIALLLGASALAQRPSDPALLVPESAPELDYVVVPKPATRLRVWRLPAAAIYSC